MTYDELAAINADDALVERLRLDPQAAVVWGDDDEDGGDELAAAMLRALQADVASEPMAASAPVLVGVDGRRPGLRRAATVAAATAGLLSLAGAAAAAVSSPADAMHGMRSVVASAVHDVIDAVTPAKARDRAHHAESVASASRGLEVSAAARSAAAARLVEERLEVARRLVALGRADAAQQVLTQARRRLALVADASHRATLSARIDDVAESAAAVPAGSTPRPDAGRHDDVSRSVKPKPHAEPEPHPARSRQPSSAASAKPRA